jgi:hypothetical protein
MVARLLSVRLSAGCTAFGRTVFRDWVQTLAAFAKELIIGLKFCHG